MLDGGQCGGNMSLRFLDTNNNPLPEIYVLSMFAGQVGQPIPVRFECRDGYFLFAVAPAGVTVEGRADGDTAWIDLLTDPIDLSPFAPEVSDFELRLTPEAAFNDDIQFRISETVGQMVYNGNGDLVKNGNNQYVLR